MKIYTRKKPMWLAAYIRTIKSLYPYFKISFKIVLVNMTFCCCSWSIHSLNKGFLEETLSTHGFHLTPFPDTFLHIQPRLVGCFEVSAVGKQYIGNLQTTNCILKLSQQPTV